MVTFEDALLQKLKSQEEHIPRNTDTPHGNASDAGGCWRKISFTMHRVAKDKQLSLADEMVLHIGRMLHKTAQEALSEVYPDALHEQYWYDGVVAGYCDSIYEEHGEKYVVEIKTCNIGTWNFVHKTGSPSDSHLRQAILSAEYYKANKIRVIYINKEPDNKKKVKLENLDDSHVIKNFYLDYTPELKTIAQMELQVFRGIQKNQREGKIVERMYQQQIIADPENTNFPCSYCPFIAKCLKLGTGTHHVDELKE